MKALLDLHGNFHDIPMTFYVNKSLITDGMIDTDKVNKAGFGYIAKFSAETTGVYLSWGINPDYNEESFLWINNNNPLTNFRLRNVKVNVGVKVTNTFSLFGWIIYSLNDLRLRIIGL